MRKAVIIVTVIALILSLVGTGVLVYFETTTPLPETNQVIIDPNMFDLQAESELETDADVTPSVEEVDTDIQP